MSNVQTAQLIFGDDFESARDKIHQLLAAQGIEVDTETMPLSQIGTHGNFFARYMFYTDEMHHIVLAAHDVTIENVADGGSTTDICGFEWLIVRRSDSSLSQNSYVDDAHRAFGKGNAENAFKTDVTLNGKDAVGADMVFETYQDLCAKHHLEWKALFNSKGATPHETAAV